MLIIFMLQIHSLFFRRIVHATNCPPSYIQWNHGHRLDWTNSRYVQVTSIDSRILHGKSGSEQLKVATILNGRYGWFHCILYHMNAII